MTSPKLAAALAATLCGTSLAVWGVRYEVNAGRGWTTAETIDVSTSPLTLDFRISVYHDGQMQLPTSAGPQTAVAPMRLCNSQKITNFGAPGSGDSLVSFRVTVSHSNPMAIAKSQAGPDMILGTPNDVHSFASNLSYAMSPPYAPAPQTQYYAGKITIGNAAPGSSSRTITLTANSFAYPNAQSGNGGTYGASFFTNPAQAIWGDANTPAVPVPAVITVQLPCPADFNHDRAVTDADFTTFAAAHDLIDCADSNMPAGCPADLNNDGTVDDTDFAIFAAAYDALTCP